jgi:ElaB/YqjD/DUF883 family membrane-anchored ribosome-binding protein
MSEPLSEDAPGLANPESEARSPVSPPVQGTAPAWDDPARHFPAGEQPEHEAGSAESMRAFTVKRGGRNAMAGTAERIGSAVGNAQREVRRRLEVVRRTPAGTIMFPSSVSASDAAERANQLAREGIEHASHMFKEIEEEVSDLRVQTARRLDDWSEQAGARVLQLRRQLRIVLSRSRAHVRELADKFPLQTVAVVAGVCFALGVALRFRSSRRG